MRKVYPGIKKVRPLEGYRLYITFSNNEKKVYNFTPNLKHPAFAELADVKLFKQVFAEEGDIFWKTGQDFCPDTLYENSVSV